MKAEMKQDGTLGDWITPLADTTGQRRRNADVDRMGARFLALLRLMPPLASEQPIRRVRRRQKDCCGKTLGHFGHYLRRIGRGRFIGATSQSPTDLCTDCFWTRAEHESLRRNRCEQK